MSTSEATGEPMTVEERLERIERLLAAIVETLDKQYELLLPSRGRLRIQQVDDEEAARREQTVAALAAGRRR